MSRTISVVFKHQLGLERVKQLVDDQFKTIKVDYVDKIGNAELTWVGDTAEVHTVVLNQAASAEVACAPTEVGVTIQLPWVVAGLSGMIEAMLRKHVGAIDVKKDAPETSPAAAASHETPSHESPSH